MRDDATYVVDTITALRAEVEQFAAVREEWMRDAALMRAEIERLEFVCKDQANVELSEENDRLIDEIEQLRTLVKDLADDLESEVNGHYPPEVRVYPSEQRRYERDMDNVYKARRALAKK